MKNFSFWRAIPKEWNIYSQQSRDYWRATDNQIEMHSSSWGETHKSFLRSLTNLKKVQVDYRAKGISNHCNFNQILEDIGLKTLKFQP